MERKVKNLEELDMLARDILSGLTTRPTATVLALSGELGAGKTAFTKSIAKALGVSENVLSPTFVLMKRYPIPGRQQFRDLVHIDAYRLDDPAEFIPLRFSEVAADPATLVLIEWPERVAEFLPEDRITLTFEVGDGDVRHVQVDPWEHS